MDPSEAPAKRPSRLKAAWQVFMGQAIVPDDLRYEWAQMQWQLEGTLEKLNSAAGRMAAKHGRELRQKIALLEAELESRGPAPQQAANGQVGLDLGDARWAAKAALARRAGVGPPSDSGPAPGAPEA